MDYLNSGDTVYLLLDYLVNGEPMQEGVYQEIELQINKEDNFRAVKKLYSLGEIVYMTDMQYEDAEGQVQSYTGYVCSLSQDDTFKISSGISEIQLRVMLNGEVGSAKCKSLDIGKVLSHRVLT